MAESKMAEFKMAEFKMAAIIKLSQNEWVQSREGNVSNFFLCKMVESKCDGRIQDGCQDHWRWLIIKLRMNEFESNWISLSQSFVQMVGINDGRM